MTVTRLISLFTAFCLMAGSQFGLCAESFEIGFKLGKSSVDSSYKYNARACARMYDALQNPSVSHISINSYASPDGKLSRNRHLAYLRGISVQDFILSNYAVDSSIVSINTVGEDWEGVKNYLKRSNKEWKQEALDIISSSSGDKKALLQDLWVGEAWDDLMKNCFPALRRVSVSIDYSAPGLQMQLDGPEIHFNQGSSVVPSSAYAQLKVLAGAGHGTLYIFKGIS